MYDILCSNGPYDQVEWIGIERTLDGAKELARTSAERWRGTVIYIQEKGSPEIIYQCVVPT